MSSINRVMLVGHLGKDPELRFLEGDVAVVSFPLATSHVIMKNGSNEEHTEWHNIVMWRNVAKNASDTLKKGKLVYLEGKLKTHRFEDKAGIKKYVTEVVVEKFIVLGSNNTVEITPPVSSD